jgi:transposase
MMGVHQTQQDLFSYHVQLEKRVRPEHPLRQVAALIDFSFIREEVAQCYGTKGNVSVDPVIILKMLFLLFYDDVASERELMAIIAERLDYMWFLGYGLEDEIPNHSVLSKARARWGTEAFKNLFVRVVLQCVQKGLVEGKKIHVDSSLIDANASKDSVLKGPPELVSALKQAYQAQETKLADTSTPQDYQSINDRTISTTDPDAALTRKNHEPARSRYHHHRVVDDVQGVITAVETTPGSIAENKKLMALVAQHKENPKTGTANAFGRCTSQTTPCPLPRDLPRYCFYLPAGG